MKKTLNILFIVSTVCVLSACSRQDANQPKAGLYRCGIGDTLTVLANLKDNKLMLSIMGTDINMKRVKSDVGSKYKATNEYGHTTVFQNVGDKATLTIDRGNPETNFYGDCVLISANPEVDMANFKAIGHEPEWNLVFNDGKFRFDMPGRGALIRFSAEELVSSHVTTDQGAVMNPTKNLSIKITDKLCSDNMSGQAHLYSVEIKYNGKIYKGCGFNNADPVQALMPI